MADTNEKILAELQKQTRLMESIERNQTLMMPGPITELLKHKREANGRGISAEEYGTQAATPNRVTNPRTKGG